MCGSMVDMQSTAAEIRRGKKKKEERKIEITGQKYNGRPYYIGDHNELFDSNLGFSQILDSLSSAHARFYWFQSAKFHEIWTQHIDRCRHESFRNRILKISRKGSFCQKTQKIEIFSTCYKSTEIHCQMIPLQETSKFSATSDASWRHTAHNANAHSNDRSTIESRDTSIMTEDRDVEMCK